MSYSHIVVDSVDAGDGEIKKTNTYTASSRVSVSESVTTGQTDFAISVAIDVSAVKSFFLCSDYAVTVETNNGTTPDDTITLVAGVPYKWNTDSYDTFQLGTDVTAIYVTNASGSTATIQLEAIVDATP